MNTMSTKFWSPESEKPTEIINCLNELPYAELREVTQASSSQTFEGIQ